MASALAAGLLAIACEPLATPGPLATVASPDAGMERLPGEEIESSPEPQEPLGVDPGTQEPQEPQDTTDANPEEPIPVTGNKTTEDQSSPEPQEPLGVDPGTQEPQEPQDTTDANPEEPIPVTGNKTTEDQDGALPENIVAEPPYPTQAINLAEFARVDWSTQNGEPPGAPAFAPMIDGSELTLFESEYAAIVAPSDAVSGPGDVFEMSLLQAQPAIDDDFWGLTFGLQPDGAVATEGGGAGEPPINNNADWVFWTWKSYAQPINQPSGPLSGPVNIRGPVRTGLVLGRVQGLVAFDEFAHRIDDAATPGVLTPLQGAVAGSLGDPGEPVAPSDLNLPQPYNIDYESRPTICTRTRYSTAGVQVWANSELVLDHTAVAPLPTGPWGLVFLAQDLGAYRVGRYLCAGDNDGDGVLDAADSDDDGDGINDSAELPEGLEGDSNSNNIPDFADFTLETFNDANGDGIDDDADLDGDGVPNHFDLDSDGDGMSDGDEVQIGTDPFNPDTDNDGLLDGEEVKVHATIPVNPDTDGALPTG